MYLLNIQILAWLRLSRRPTAWKDAEILSVLSQFRDRLIGAGMDHAVLDVILARCDELGLLRVGGRPAPGLGPAVPARR
jgi:hypothetical protein